MANKKKSSNKKKASRAARPKSAKPSTKPSSAAKPVSQTEAQVLPPEPVSQPWRLRPEVLLLLVSAVLALVVIGVLANFRKSQVTPAPTSSVYDDTPSTLQVVGGEGTGSTSSADTLQPQPSGLQQVPTTRQANDTNLQAPNTPEINPSTLLD
jgi:hypothetical protein